MKLLLDRGVNVNARTRKFGQTAVMWAAGYPAIVRLLLERGAKATDTDGKGKTVEAAAASDWIRALLTDT